MRFPPKPAHRELRQNELYSQLLCNKNREKVARQQKYRSVPHSKECAINHSTHKVELDWPHRHTLRPIFRTDIKHLAPIHISQIYVTIPGISIIGDAIGLVWG